ncbi:Alpha/beta hydrolase fold [Trema orientale]|uniref:Alpha/beta hydrolase fold n=1 Tax=Trema orientale TaxID=63057 RepID=A0A2P5E8Z7_TREOI|nr:Alpha/beta hydrolase fold [Trema orientale]
MAVRVGVEGLVDGVELRGVVLVQPYFSGVEPIGDEVAGKAAGFTYPTSTGGSDDPLMNPAKDPNLGRLGCGRVLVCVAEKDGLKDRGLYYSEVLLENSEWEGRVEVMETKGEDHIFHLLHPTCDNALDMMSCICTFLDQ